MHLTSQENLSLYFSAFHPYITLILIELLALPHLLNPPPPQNNNNNNLAIYSNHLLTSHCIRQNVRYVHLSLVVTAKDSEESKLPVVTKLVTE